MSSNLKNEKISATTLTPDVEMASLLFLRSSWELNLKYQALLQPYDLNYMKFFALGFIAISENGVTPESLVHIVNGHAHTIDTMLNELENAGLIATDHSKGFKLIHASPKGHKVMDEISPNWCMLTNHYWSGLSQQDNEHLISVFKRMIELPQGSAPKEHQH